MDTFRTINGQRGMRDQSNRYDSFVDISASRSSSLLNNKVISLFSGAGGLDRGLESAGYETALCVEIDADCRATLAHNRPTWTLFDEKIPGHEV